MSDERRGLGHNSQNFLPTSADNADYQTLNPADLELVAKIKQKLKDITKLLNKADAEHRASHGDDYYFADEVNEKESCDALGKVKFGVHRRPNPYEKKAFARDAENNINKAWCISHDLKDILNKLAGGSND